MCGIHLSTSRLSGAVWGSPCATKASRFVSNMRKRPRCATHGAAAWSRGSFDKKPRMSWAIAPHLIKHEAVDAGAPDVIENLSIRSDRRRSQVVALEAGF